MTAVFERVSDMYPLVQVVSPDGSVVGREPVLSGDQLVDMYAKLLLLRTFDQKALNLARQGRIGNYLSYSGQEACQLGSVYPLQQQDWVFPTYRDHGAMVCHGVPHRTILRYFYGDEWGNHTPAEINVAPVSIPIATQLLHAVGVGYAARLKGDPVVAVGFVGNGGTSPGDFHEALNFASVWNTPTIIFVQNNHWAISTPNRKQFKPKTIAQRSVAYDIPGYLVDGQDLLAVVSVMQEAVERARSGGGPTLVECLTYRYQPHSTAGDDPRRYRAEDEYEEWLAKDPVARFQAYLRKKEVWTESLEENLLAVAREQVESAVSEALAMAKPSPADIFDYVYAELPPHLQRQKEELKAHLARHGEGGAKHG
jgi:pyruvate dehydrogenase E1 component alpha subunit